MRDQIRGVKHLKSLDFIDKTDLLFTVGGGFMTTNLMCSYPNVFTCGIAGGPVIDWKFYEVMYTERFMDTPRPTPEGYENTSLLNKAKNLKGELLMIHGAQDDKGFATLYLCSKMQRGCAIRLFPIPQSSS